MLTAACSREPKSLGAEQLRDLSPKGCSVQKLNDCSKLELDRCKIDSGSCSDKKADSPFGDIKP